MHDIWCCIFDFLDGNDATIGWEALSLFKIVPSKDLYWKNRVINLLSYTEELEEVYFRLGFYYPKTINYRLLLKKLYTVRKCSRSGCYRKFYEVDGTLCCYHPGKKVNNKLTCCRGTFSTPGCTNMEYHNGEFHEMVYSDRNENDL